jgi:hypothetical protein
MLSAVLRFIRGYLTLLLEEQPTHHRYNLLGPGVIKLDSFNFLSLIVDRDQTVSRRFKPNSRTILIGEQPNPWHHLQRQDMISRHRGAKRPHR